MQQTTNIWAWLWKMSLRQALSSNIEKDFRFLHNKQESDVDEQRAERTGMRVKIWDSRSRHVVYLSVSLLIFCNIIIDANTPPPNMPRSTLLFYFYPTRDSTTTWPEHTNLLSLLSSLAHRVYFAMEISDVVNVPLVYEWNENFGCTQCR